jgi:hypothetical protein
VCFCFWVWCHGKGQRRFCDTLSAVGNGWSINDNSLSNNESTVSFYDVACMMWMGNRTGTTTLHYDISWGEASRVPRSRPRGCLMNHDTLSPLVLWTCSLGEESCRLSRVEVLYPPCFPLALPCHVAVTQGILSVACEAGTQTSKSQVDLLHQQLHVGLCLRGHH